MVYRFREACTAGGRYEWRSVWSGYRLLNLGTVCRVGTGYCGMILGASVCMNGVGTICGDRSGWTRWVEVCLVHGVLAGKRYQYRGSEMHCVFVGYCFCFCSWMVFFVLRVAMPQGFLGLS